MGYYIGIDGGGTKTLACLCNEKKEILSSIQVSSTNYHSVGIEKVKIEFEEIFNFFKASQGIALDNIKGICIGGAGVDGAEDQKIIKRVFRDIGYKNNLQVYNDSIIALVGANGGKKGAILISGTGSIAFGIDKAGKEYRVGGWGHIIDDVGSGYAIARDGLKKIMESYDGREEESTIWEAVSSELGILHIGELISFIYNPNTKKHDIARLAPCIINLYEIDRVAKKVVDKAVRDLCKMIEALANKMNEKDFSLGLSGSVFLKSDLIRELFTKNINQRYPKIYVHLPDESAVKGALILAVEEYK
ncbi:N-acetylglucosamine kinase [Paramaledivibacter caminithermalis]|jgi:N-acetylglucosamine kinase-like BadF-type ATPase|uniref:BadF-type ATPase n=1 Tax=Paramaledivibacter caminithermalis (strain DSM 15212 / CIP 107654 / DViRD3) TaxID=1121301 RepID=A0A1M6PGL1_PARC5|nr:BadF/BadG/BcrA/BcrD ATPase family protein [Paramaledivibacter caminithermalis]SHK07079.1 BadF-type ATPase [Paramaledivibacter caminithermalis DSM 15212]